MTNRRTNFCCSIAVLGVAALAGCSSGSTICLTGGDDGEVCAEFDDGGAFIVASGLAPGSELVVAFGDLPDAEYIVDEDGSVSGVGALSLFADAPIDLRIAATAANGEPITGELSNGK